MRSLIYGIILYFLAFIVDYKILKKVSLKEYEYMALKFNLKRKKKIPIKINIISSMINAFIITLVWLFNFLCEWHLLIKLTISFGLLILSIYICYEIYGRILRSRGYGKKVTKK